jgi:hypothetical protein
LLAKLLDKRGGVGSNEPSIIPLALNQGDQRLNPQPSPIFHEALSRSRATFSPAVRRYPTRLKLRKTRLADQHVANLSSVDSC